MEDRWSHDHLARLAATLLMLVTMSVSVWGASQTYSITTPSQNVYTDPTSGITVIGTATTGKIDNSTSQKIFSAEEDQPLHITSIIANIKGIRFDYDDSRSGSGSENIMNIQTSNGASLAAPTSGYTGNISLNGGASTSLPASLAGLAVGKDQSTHCTISVEFTSAVSTIVVNTTGSNAAQIRNLVIIYDDEILARNLYATITPTGANTYSVSGEGEMTTASVDDTKMVIGGSNFYKLNSKNTYTPTKSLVAGDIVVFTVGNTSSKSIGINVESAGDLRVEKGIASQPYQIVYVVPSDKSSISFKRSSSDTYLKDIRVYHKTPAVCTAPEKPTISGWYHYFPGETIALTADANGTSGSTTYTWKNGGSTVAGQTTANLSIASCTAANAGKYTVVASNGGGCESVSNEYSVKILQSYLKDNSGTDLYNAPLTKVDATHARISFELSGNTTYRFNITDGCNNWYGNDGTMNKDNCSNWAFTSSNDCCITTTKAGVYVVTVDYSDLARPVVSVEYPSSNQAAGKTIYFDNSERNWNESKIYYRIGKGDYNSKQQMTKVSGTANLFKVVTNGFDGFEAWHIANNGCWSEGISIYKTNTGDGLAATEAVKFIGNAVTSTIIVVPTSEHIKGTDGNNNNCEFYSYQMVDGMKSHTATITAPSNGTITVAYKDVDNVDKNFTSGNKTLAHTCVLTITATPATGYALTALTVNSQAFISGNTHVLSADATIAATFAAKTTSITINANTANHGSTAPAAITATYGQSLPAFTAAAGVSGYQLKGYYTAATDGTKVINADGTLVASINGYTNGSSKWIKEDANVTLYAQYEAAAPGGDIAVVIFDGSTMSNIATSPISGVSWKATGLSATNKNVTGESSKSYTKVLATGGSTGDSHSLSITIPSGYTAKFYVSQVTNSNGNERSAFIATNKTKILGTNWKVSSSSSTTASYGLSGSYAAGDYWLNFDNSINFAEIKVVLTSTTYAVTYNNGGRGTAPENTTASQVTLTQITGVDGWTNTGWKANVVTTVDAAAVAANTLIANGKTVVLSAATTFTAQWEENTPACTPVVTWNVQVSKAETTVTTSSKSSSDLHITNVSNIGVAGLTVTSGDKPDATNKIQSLASKDASKYLSMTFDVADGYQFTPSALNVPTTAVSKAKTIEVIISDATNSESQTWAQPASASSTPTAHEYSFSKHAYMGTVTVKIMAYGETSGFRLGNPITICGDVETASCTTPTLSWTTAPADGTVGDADATILATSNSAGAITYDTEDHAVATIVDGKLHYVAAGTTNVTATVAANGEYCEKTIKQAITVAAALAPTKYTITVNDAGAGQHDCSKNASAAADETVSIENTCEVTGYHLTGYTSSPEVSGTLVGTTYTFTMPASNVTLTAVWEADAKYTVTFVANGATGSVPTETAKTAGTKFTLPSATGLTYADHVFVGWKSSANDVTYNAGEQYTMTAANTTFTAQWRESAEYHTIVPNIEDTRYESYSLHTIFTNTTTVSPTFPWVSGSFTAFGSTWTIPAGEVRYKNDGQTDAKFRANVVTFKVTNCVSVAIAGKSGSTSRNISISVKEKDSDVEVGTVASSNLNSYKSVVYGSALDPDKKYVVSITSSDPENNSYIGAISFEAPGLTPAATPMITTQPVQPEAYCAGDAITALAVAATTSDAGTLSYQWYKGDTKVGTNSTSYTPTEAGVYKCVVKNTLADHDPATVASDVVTITINAATAITNQPTASQTVPAGSPVSLTVAATGTDLSYQWKSCATVDGEYTPIMTVAAGKATYTFTPNAVGDTYYKCAITGACGTETSNAALVTVTTAAPTVIWNTETTAYKGQLLTVSVTTNSDAALNVNDLTTNGGTLVDKQLVGKTYTAKLQVPTDATGTITLTLNTAAGTTFGALESNHEIAISGSCPDRGTETLYSFTLTDDNINKEGVDAIGGTATTKGINQSSTTYSGKKFYKTGGAISLSKGVWNYFVRANTTLELHAGDVITIECANSSTSTKAAFSLYANETTTPVVHAYTIETNKASQTVSYTIQESDGIQGTHGFQFGRDDSNAFIHSVTVTRTGTATSLTWDDAEVTDGGTLEKTVGDADFTIPAISNSIGTISYTSGTTATATVNASGTVHIVNTGTTVITATVDAAGCYAGKSITYTLRVNAACEAPVITKNLSTDIVEYVQGASATALSISATGSNLRYQWYKNTTDDTENGMAVGTDAASYTPSTAELGTTYYYCVVSSGACTTTSAVAKIVVMADACFTDNTEHALSSNDATYVIDLGAGSSFEAGTVIYGRVKVGTVKGGDGVKVQNATINICAGTNIAAKDTWYDFAYVVPANSQLIGQQSITFVRASGTNTRIKDVKVTGCGTPCALPQPLIVAGTPVVDQETCQETVLLTAKTPDGTANYNIGGGTMQWYKDGEAIPSATAVTYMVTEEGTYYVMFTNGCSVMSSNSYIEKNLEPGVQRLAPLQYYHVGKTYTEQMKDRHLFVVNSFGLHDGNTYLLEATLNGEEYNVTTIRSAIYTIADDDVANTDTVMIDLNALNGKGFNVGDELVLSVSPVNLCGNYVDDLKQSITIYMIDETPTLAFIVSGADGAGTKKKANFKLDGDFLTGYNKADLKTQTNATAVSEAELPLYTALRSEFKVTPVNGYAVFNIFNYEPFDLLFLTDFVKSDGSADKAAAKKHVEALGNLVDYRPMFSTKGHMSGFNNWKEKGFTANPTVPKQTQVLMNIVCYAHPMFEGLSPDGENIYYDAIDNNETVFRMLSQGGYDSNKGIQGFEMNGANEFIKIALTHYDAHGTPDGNIMTPTAEADDRTLIASCERQANIEARFIILSLNADATSFLTEAGIDVIIRSLSYLLETNPIKVTDCHFDFDNAHGTGVWSDPANWAPRHNVLPTKNVDVRISANCIVDTTSAVAASVKVKEGFTLTIADTAALTIQGIAQHQNAEGKLSPTSPSDLVVSGSSTGTGAFIHGDEAGKTGATVQMYSKANATADVDGSGATVDSWQWMTTPYNDVADAQYNYYGAWMYRYDNNNHQWSPQVVNGNGMTPFGGYCITQEGPKVYTMTGTLASTADQNISLVSGLNMVGNSWTAPINIAAFQDADFVNVQKTITILNTGLDANGSGASTQGVNNTPGQYVVIPIHSAAKMHNTLKVIPSMQAFELKATGTGAKLTLDYDRLVRTSSVNIQPMRAPGRSMAERTDDDYVNGIRLGDINTLRVSVTGNRYSAEVYLLENENFSNDYEDGWDGEWTRGDKAAVQLFARVNGVKYAVSALSTLVGAQLGTYKGEDTEYTIHFDYTGEQQLWWYDTKTGVYTEITNENTYTFTNTTTAVQYRFLITAVNPNMPTVPTGWDGIDDDSGPRKFIMDNHVYIMVNGALYDATGRLVY